MQTSSQQQQSNVGGPTIQQQQQQSNTPPIATSNNNNNTTNTNTNTNSTTTPPQHFCLRWNNYQTNLTNVFDQLLQNESFVDVTLACDGHSVKAHKMVLSACSPYFQSLFFDNPCQHPIIIMRDIKWPELKAAVEFMYKGEINVSQEQIGPLLKVAESLKIRGLADVNGGGGNENESLMATTAPPTNYHQKSSSASSSSSVVNNNRPRSRSNRSNNIDNSWQSPTNPQENRIPIITPPSQHHLSHHPDDFDDDNMQIATSPQSMGGARTPPTALTPRLTNNSLSKKRRRYSNEQRSRESSSCRSSPAISGVERGGGGERGDRGDNMDYHHQVDLSSPVQQQQHRDMIHSPSSSVGGGVAPTPPPPPLVAPPPPPTPSHTPRTPTLSTPGPTPTPPGLGGGVGSLSVSICNDRERSTPVQLSMFNEQMSQLSRQMSDGGPMSSPSASSVVAAHHHQQQLAAAAAAAAAAHHQLSLSGGGNSSIHPDDMEIKPGIAEMIREEERAKLLESSHAWLGASTSSIAGNHKYRSMLKLKAPTWTQSQLKEAIEAVVTQKMRFTQASARFGIPKGTLYDNILGKSKRMVVLEEAGLTKVEEDAVLEFCCDVSVSPYNRRTKKSLTSVLAFVEKLRRARDPEFMFTGLSGFRWWWAFCKKHSIVSLYYENNNTKVTNASI